jgi:hypothetical protein
LKRAIVAVVSLASLTILTANLAAQAQRVVSPAKSSVVEPGVMPTQGLTKVYSNLGTKTDSYDDGISYQITGPGNPLFGKGYLAMPFTPAQASEVKLILIALGNLGGNQDSGTFGLFTDLNGVPGTPLRTWTASNFPIEGTCCKLVPFAAPKGIPVQAGQRYWVVAGTGLGQDNSQYEWNFVWNDASGTVAFLNGNTNDQWLQYNDNVAAFAVYGTLQ